MERKITPQDRGGEQWLDFETLVVPYDLGKIEFLPPQEMFDRYAKVIGDADAAFVTHAFRASTMMHSKLAPKPGEAQINSGHEAVYFNRPVPGKKLIMTGAIVEKYIKRGLPYIVIEMNVADEDGRKIENVRHISMLKASGLGKKWWGGSLANVAVGTQLSPVVKRFTKEDMVEAEAIAALFGRSYETIHNDDEIAAQEGLQEIIGSGNDMASHVHELMKKFAGPDWVQGGTVSIRFIRPVVAGDVITYKGKVIEKQNDNGRTRIVVDVVGENQRGEAAVVGKASALAA